MTRLGAGRAGGYVPYRDKLSLFSEIFKRALGPTRQPLQWVRRFLSVGVKRLGREVTTRLHLLLRLMSGALPCLSLRAFIAWTGTAVDIRCILLRLTVLPLFITE